MTIKMGIDEFAEQETVFRDFSRGTTIPLEFQLYDDENETMPTDATGWQVWVTISYVKDSTTFEDEIPIPAIDAQHGKFEGYIEDDITYSLKAGPVFMSAKFIRSDGRTFIFDKAEVEVFESLNPRRS